MLLGRPACSPCWASKLAGRAGAAPERPRPAGEGRGREVWREESGGGRAVRRWARDRGSGSPWVEEREAPSATAWQAANDAAHKPPSLAAGSQPRTPPPVLPMGPATETAQGQEPAGLRSGHRLQEFPDFCARGSASPDIILWKCAQPLHPRLTGENDQIDARASSFSFPTDSQKAGIFVPVIQG